MIKNKWCMVEGCNKKTSALVSLVVEELTMSKGTKLKNFGLRFYMCNDCFEKSVAKDEIIKNYDPIEARSLMVC